MTLLTLPDVKALFDRISEGDEVAFKACYAHYGPLLMPSLIRLIGHREGAEDVLQDVFLNVWLLRERLAEVESPKSWLFRITANAARNWLKKEMRGHRKILELGRELGAPKTQNNDQLDFRTLEEVIRRTVQSFPTQRRRIYEMSRDEGLKPAEIASILNISVNTVKNTLVSALKTIRENIQEAGLWSTFLLFLLKK